MHLKKRLEINGHSGAIYTIDGVDDFVFTGSGDRFSAKWNLTSGIQEKFALKSDQSIYKLKLINQAKQLIIGTSTGTLHIIDLVLNKEIKHFIQHKVAVFEICENTLKNHIYTTDADGNLAIWDSNTWNLLLFLPFDCGKIRQVLVSKNGERLYLACQNGEIKILETAYFNEIESIKAHHSGVNALQINPLNHNSLFSTGKDGYIRIWNIDSFHLIKEIPAHNFGIYQLDFFNHGQNFISISRDKSIKFWGTEKLTVLQKLERKHGGHSHAINAFYKKSETELVTVGDDKRIIYWELTSDL